MTQNSQQDGLLQPALGLTKKKKKKKSETCQGFHLKRGGINPDILLIKNRESFESYRAKLCLPPGACGAFNPRT